MNKEDENDITAAEYVLGTLDDAARVEVSRRRLLDSALDRAITAWENRLSPLLDEIAPVVPPKDLLARIQAAIASDLGQATPKRDPALSGDVKAIVGLQRSVLRWKAIAAGAMALAASMAGFIVLWETALRPEPKNVVGLFQKDDGRPSFLLTVDLATREILIRPLTAEAIPGKSYQLWIVSDKLGPGPRSLGLLPATLSPTRKTLEQFDPALLRSATFGISVEPQGGSPTGKPSGPALHSKLYPATL